MATKTINNRDTEREGKAKAKRPGIVAKSKTSKLKSSKLYRKPYRGQGR